VGAHRFPVRGAAIALVTAAIVAGTTGCPIRPRPTTPLPVAPVRPCVPASMRCPRDLEATLTPLGLDAPLAQAVSGSGEIVGIGDAAARDVGFRIAPDGAARLVREPLDGMWFRAVNAQGLIAGVSTGPESHPMVWDAQDRPTDLRAKLPLFGAEYVSGAATDVNERGEVAGYYQLRFAPGTDGERTLNLPFVWDSRTDTLTVVNPEAVADPPAFVMESPVGIDDQGVVAFSFHPGPVNSQVTRMVPQPDGRYRRQTLEEGVFYAINGRGDILGSGVTSQPTVWPAGTTKPIRLTPPPGWTPTTTEHTFTAADINDRGEVVGTYSNRGDEMRPLRWPGFTQPPELLETDNRAKISIERIGDDGTITGTWFPPPAGTPPPSTPIIGSDRRALVWDPIP
jgi:hypothetical protein